MVECGVDPRCLDTMSLYEILSMFESLKKRQEKAGGKKKVTNEEWKQAEEMLASVTVNDPKVKLH